MCESQFDHTRTSWYAKLTLVLSALSVLGVLSLGILTLVNERAEKKEINSDSVQIAVLDSLFMSEKTMLNLNKSLADRVYKEPRSSTEKGITEAIEICAQTLSILPEYCQIELHSFEQNRLRMRGPQGNVKICSAQDALLGVISMLVFFEGANPADWEGGGNLSWDKDKAVPLYAMNKELFGQSHWVLDMPKNVLPIWECLLGTEEWLIGDILNELIPDTCSDITNELQLAQKSILEKHPHLSPVITASRIQLVQSIDMEN